MKNRKVVKQLSLIMIFSLMFIISRAQGPGFDDDVEDTPLDGGAAFIIAAAAGYGYKKIADKRKRNAK